MTLLYLAIAYTAGILLGRAAWDAGWFDCAERGSILAGNAHWLWIAPLGAALLTPFLERFRADPAPQAPLRWPESAGFIRPRTGVSPALMAACCLCLLAGGLRYVAAPIDPCRTPHDLAYYNVEGNSRELYAAQRVRLDGYVSSYPTVRDTRQRMVVQVDHLLDAEGAYRAVTGLARVSVGIEERFDYGDPVQIVGVLTEPRRSPSFESWVEYLARQDVYSVVEMARVERRSSPLEGSPLYRAIYDLRRSGERMTNRLLPEPYAALANGILLGIDSIPQQVRAHFDETGTSHVLVISGSNVALVAGAILLFARRLFGRGRALFPALLGIASYVILVGAEPPVLRAGVMGGLVVFAAAMGRQSAALIGLAAASWAMALHDPAVVWDAGFHLSVAATAGLILFAPVLYAGVEKWLPAKRRYYLQVEGDDAVHATGWTPFFMAQQGGRALGQLLLDGLIVTIAANIGALPVVVYHFGRLSAITIPANVLIAPVQPWIMALGMPGIVAAVAGWEGVAQALLWGPWLALRWTWAVARWGSSQLWAGWQVEGYGLFQLALTYALIAAVYWRRWAFDRVRAGAAWFNVQSIVQKAGGVLVPALLIGNILLWQATFSQPDALLHVHFLDVDRGGVLIVTPSGRQVLIDGGSSPEALFAELGEVMPYWDRSLDIVTITQPDAAHSAAQAEIPSRFDVALALDTPVGNANPEAAQWRGQMAEAGVAVELTHAGGWIDLGNGVALWVLWPEADSLPGADGSLDAGDNALLLKLVYGDFSVLFVGDSGERARRAWVREGLPLAATVLAVARNGAEEMLLDAVNPQIVVVQGRDESGEGIDPTFLELLEGYTLQRSDLHGRIDIASDGRQMWVEGEQ